MRMSTILEGVHRLSYLVSHTIFVKGLSKCLVDLSDIGIHLVNTIEHTHTHLLINTLERQVSWGDTDIEVVGQ